MKKKNRIATIITQYTLYGESEIKKVSDVLDKIEKDNQRAMKAYLTKNYRYDSSERKRKSRRVIVKK